MSNQELKEEIIYGTGILILLFGLLWCVLWLGCN